MQKKLSKNQAFTHLNCHAHTRNDARANRQKKCAFTLAEVLITLAIIGVVAALTIPTVVRNYQKQQTVVKLKKVYTALANTTNLAILDNGPITTWVVADDFASKFLIPYLKVSKNCGYEAIPACEAKYSYLYTPNVKNLLDESTYHRFYLNDGTFIGVDSANSSTRKYAKIYVDLNGQKEPNIYGKDIFIFSYFISYDTPTNPSNGKFFPGGNSSAAADRNNRDNVLGKSGNTWGACAKQNYTESGRDCVKLIMLDGWQIKDDYPW